MNSWLYICIFRMSCFKTIYACKTNQIWLYTVVGYLYHLEPYCGDWSIMHDYGLGCGGNVFASLVEAWNVKPGSQLYFDTYFGSLNLLDYLSELDISATLRSNRLENCPLLDATSIRKNECGYFETFSNIDLATVTQWLDNNNIIVVSNTFSSSPAQSVRRYQSVINLYDSTRGYLSRLLFENTTKVWAA